MEIIQIETRGEISFPVKMETTAGYRYDIPFDNVSLPSLPLSDAIREQVSLPEGTVIGRAHPAGYLGLISFARRMLDTIPHSSRFIRDYFTQDRFDRKLGYSIRSVKAGIPFEAQISFPPQARAEVQKALSRITRLGISEAGISGEVTVTLAKREYDQDGDDLSELCQYRSLDYTVMLLSSACFYEPYRSGSSTST